MYHRDIVILANSRRMGGHCIAGKDLDTGEWVRPINHGNFERRDMSAFNDHDLLKMYGRSDGPQLLECVRIGFFKACPSPCQPENEYIDKKPWKSIGMFETDDFAKILDDGSPQWLGRKDILADGLDRISGDFIEKHPLSSSLVFLKLRHSKNEMKFIPDTDYHNRARRRMKFLYEGRRYSLVVKDIRHLHPLVDGVQEEIIPDTYATLGLTEKHPETGAHYKLVVGLIPCEPVESE
jgi:hypothetical protein